MLYNGSTVIRPCTPNEEDTVCAIINDGALAYRGIIPADRWHEPYMSSAELRREVRAGVQFWGYLDAEALVGVMGIQPVLDVTLIRHAYVRSSHQRLGIGARLLAHLRDLTSNPILIGTWADARWAVRFYERHGFQQVSAQDKDRLLRKYWTVPDRQIDTSVVLADSRWRDEAAQLSRRP